MCLGLIQHNSIWMTFHFLILIALTPDKPLMFMYQNVYMFICLFDHMFNYICKCMFKFLHQKKTNLLYKIGKGLEILIAVVFCKECVLPVQWWFLFCKGGEDGRGTDGGGGRTKSRIARPKHIIKSCVKMHMNSNIHNEFPAPLTFYLYVLMIEFIRRIFLSSFFYCQKKNVKIF